MALRAQAGASDLTSAANAFEALVRNGDPEAPYRGFRRTIAAAAYHLAGFSAVADSPFDETADDLNASPGETAVRHLILRDLGQLRGFVREWLDDAAHGDEQFASALTGEEPDIDGCGALSPDSRVYTPRTARNRFDDRARRSTRSRRRREDGRGRDR